MDSALFDELLTPVGAALMAQIHARAGIESDLALGTRLRRDHPAELVALAVTQNHLRGKAVAKFGPDAASMFFTHEALEQSTRSVVATHRATRLAATGVTSVVDLGCGIGGDLIAFARAGLLVHGVEHDHLRAAIATANLAALGLQGTVTTGDALTTAIEPGQASFVDPARRDGRGRVFGVDGLVPPWPFVTELLAGHGVAKVMPGIAHDAVPQHVEAEWVSEGGDLVEACLWGAGFGSPVTRRATVLPSGETLVATGETVAEGDIAEWLIEPDDAVIRSGLVAEFAAQVDGHLLDRQIAYVTSSTGPTGTALGRWFRVVDELPFREKQLRAALVARDIGTLTIKKRGIDLTPEHLIRRLKLRGSNPATVVITRAAAGARAFLVDPAR